jgi:hypothetical protein
MHFVKGEQMTRCVSVGSCNESKAPIENMSPMFPWEIERVAAEFEAGPRISFKYLLLPSLWETLEILGKFNVGQSVSFHVEMARIECPHLPGHSIQEEVDMDIQIIKVDESTYKIKDGLTS